MRFIDCGQEEFCNLIEKRKIICIGAGTMFRKALETFPIAGKITGLIDNNPSLQQTIVTVGNRKLLVHTMDLLERIQEKEYIILITTRFYESIRKQLEEKFPDKELDVFVFPWVEAYLSRREDQERFWQVRMVEPALMFYEEHLQHRREVTPLERERLVSEKKIMLETAAKEDRLIVPKIGIRHKSSCTLKCRGCSMLIPQVKDPYYIAAEQVLEDLKLFLECVDFCVSVGISDGEPFLDRELDKILAYLIACPKIDSISFNTNGTILPQESLIPYLKNPKVFIRISDYGYLGSMAKLIELFEREQIAFSVLSEMKWLDVRSTEKKMRSDTELKYDFLRCMNSLTCKVLADGVFYACERCFRLERLGIYKPGTDGIRLKDYVLEDRCVAIREMYLAELAYGCDYCDLGSMEASVIDAGIQDNGRMKSSYTIVKREG